MTGIYCVQLIKHLLNVCEQADLLGHMVCHTVYTCGLWGLL